MHGQVVCPAVKQVCLAEEGRLLSFEPIGQLLGAAAEARHLSGIERGEGMEHAIRLIVGELPGSERHRGTTASR